MVEMGVNYWAVLVAGLAAWVLGAIWYAGPVFGNTWMQAIGKTKEQIKEEYSPMKMVWALIGYLIAAYGIARIMSWSGGPSLRFGIMVALLAVVCFSIATHSVDFYMENRPMKLFWINEAYKIVTFVVMGVILGVW